MTTLFDSPGTDGGGCCDGGGAEAAGTRGTSNVANMPSRCEEDRKELRRVRAVPATRPHSARTTPSTRGRERTIIIRRAPVGSGPPSTGDTGSRGAFCGEGGACKGRCTPPPSVAMRALSRSSSWMGSTSPSHGCPGTGQAGSEFMSWHPLPWWHHRTLPSARCTSTIVPRSTLPCPAGDARRKRRCERAGRTKRRKGVDPRCTAAPPLDTPCA